MLPTTVKTVLGVVAVLELLLLLSSGALHAHGVDRRLILAAAGSPLMLGFILLAMYVIFKRAGKQKTRQLPKSD